MVLLETFIEIIIIWTLFITLLMLPVYFIRKKRCPYDPKNTILKLVIKVFLAVTIMTLLFGSGLIVMFFDDLMT